jgi:HEAT repeat protein
MRMQGPTKSGKLLSGLAVLLSVLLTVAASSETPTRTDADVAREIARLQSQDIAVRNDAEEKLISMGARAVPALAGALHDPNPSVRFTADLALDRIGPGAKAAVPDLVATLHDPTSM